MFRRLALTATASVLAIPLLVGCGGSSSSKSATSTAGSAGATSQNQGDSQQPSSSDSPGSSAADTPGAPAAGDKPSKDDVKAGLVKFYATKGVTGQPATMLAGCIVDKGYDKFSAQTLNAMKDGDPSKLDQNDSTTFVQVSGECASANGGLPTSLPTKG